MRALTLHVYADSHAFALNSEVRHLARRLAYLESLFQASNPGVALLPNDAPALSTSNSIGPSPASASADFNSPTSPYRRQAQEEILEEEESATRQSHSDTEDAAANLEDVAFGARVPVLQAINAAAQATSKRQNQNRAAMELTSALTSILAEPLSYDQDGRPRSAVRLGLDLAISTADLLSARSGAMAQIFAVLPGKDISDFLIAKVGRDVS
jgi:hypothetical protein